MADIDKIAQKRNVSGEPVAAEPNHIREKTYEPASTPKAMKDEAGKMPESTAEEKVREDMPAAADAVKDQLR